MGKPVNAPARQLFQPTDSRRIKTQEPTLTGIINVMYNSSKDACIFDYVDILVPTQYPVEDDINVSELVEVTTSEAVPHHLRERASQATSCTDFLENLPTFS